MQVQMTNRTVNAVASHERTSRQIEITTETMDTINDAMANPTA